jgi:O-antigen chain-terminating methyltransferase
MVFDVDGQVINADDLVERVRRLIRTIDEKDPSPVEPDQTAVPSGRIALVEAPLHSMQAALADLHPPELGRPAGARGRVSVFVKRLVRRLTSWYVEPRWIHQERYDGQNLELASGIVNQFHRLDAELDEMRRQNTRLKLQVVASVERLNRHRREVERLFENAATQEDTRFLSRQLERVGAAGVSGAEIDYVDFENRCRGSSEQLREAQSDYLTLFPPPGDGKVIDIGCGRGEMLELLMTAGYDVLGVDTDKGMIEVCRSKGLPVVEDNGIHFLEETEDDSLRGIFCAQVVEHLLTSEVERLMLLARQKLLTSGVLVVETINPRSSYALGNHFFADTSHVRPVHPETLRFICEQVGFSRVQLEERSLHPFVSLAEGLPESQVGTAVEALLKNVFGYQDYVIVATK